MSGSREIDALAAHAKAKRVKRKPKPFTLTMLVPSTPESTTQFLENFGRAQEYFQGRPASLRTAAHNTVPRAIAVVIDGVPCIELSLRTEAPDILIVMQRAHLVLSLAFELADCDLPEHVSLSCQADDCST